MLLDQMLLDESVLDEMLLSRCSAYLSGSGLRSFWLSSLLVKQFVGSAVCSEMKKLVKDFSLFYTLE